MGNSLHFPVAGSSGYCAAHSCFYTPCGIGVCPLCFADTLYNVYGVGTQGEDWTRGDEAKKKLAAFNDELDDRRRAVQPVGKVDAPFGVFAPQLPRLMDEAEAEKWEADLDPRSRWQKFMARFGLGDAALTCEYHLFEAIDTAKKRAKRFAHAVRGVRTVGTRSVLFGAHCWFIHPFFVAEAWRRLYGFPTDPRLWAAFFVHDLGYVGKRAMDDADGERHCEWGAMRMTHWFDARDPAQKGKTAYLLDLTEGDDPAWFTKGYTLGDWGQFCLFHSRFYAKNAERPVSRLCYADKLAVTLEPWWFYLPRVWATGELVEYMSKSQGEQGSKYNAEPEVGPHCRLCDLPEGTPTYQRVRHWHRRMVFYLRLWVETHKNGADDTWTSNPAQASSEGAAA